MFSGIWLFYPGKGVREAKKKFESPELHRVCLNIDRSMSELENMTDKELFQVLKDSDYYQNKTLYKTGDDVVTRMIAGETVLVPVGRMAQKLNGMATFSETGQFLWKLLNEKPCSRDDLVYALALECQCKPKELQEDVEAYLQKMQEYGFVVRCETAG